MKQFLEAGQIINQRGLKGELKVDCFCDSLDVLCGLKTLYFDEKGSKPVKVLSAKQYKGYAYIILDGFSTLEAAQALRGEILYADRDEIPLSEGSFFVDDLLGLPLIDADNGKIYGYVTDVFNRGASDIYTVVNGDNTYYFPAADEFISEIDLEKGIYIRPIPGMFDEAEQV